MIEARGSVAFWSHVWFLMDGGWLDNSGYLRVSDATMDTIEKAATSGLPEFACVKVPMAIEEASRIAKATDNCLSTLNERHEEAWWERLRAGEYAAPQAVLCRAEVLHREIVRRGGTV